ncbi:hypothetical protein LSA03nite_05880 [Latilactobacillus sakei subsp. carnosus]|nr:hypothetical protein LSA03nite_05880 [Latilactobacillus sakei subsp. carnosus]
MHGKFFHIQAPPIIVYSNRNADMIAKKEIETKIVFVSISFFYDGTLF